MLWIQKLLIVLRSKFGVLVWIITFSSLTGWVEACQSDPPLIEDEISVNDRNSAGIYARQYLSLGALDAGGEYMWRLVIRNDGQNPFKFRRVEGSCSCMEIQVREGEVLPGKSITVGTKFSVNSNVNRATQQINLNFFEELTGDIPVFSINASGRIKGLVKFDFRDSVIEAGPGITSFRIPLNVTLPVIPNDLVVESSESFRDLLSQIETEDNGTAHLKLDVAEAVVEEGNLQGWLKIKDPVSLREDKLELMIRLKSRVSISPQIARFHKVVDQDSVMWKASGFLTAAPPMEFNKTGRGDVTGNETDEETSDLPDPLSKITASIDGIELDVNWKRMHRGVYRFEIVARPQDFKDQTEGEIQWTAEVSGKEYRQKTYWSIKK